MRNHTWNFFFLMVLFLNHQGIAQEQSALFRIVPSSQSKISFNNQINENDTVNYFTQDNIYNGAGIAIGDINNDGLPDVFFVSNQGKNRLYLNKGKLKFKDITDKAFNNQDCSGWKSGVTMADINTDGWLDIYVCRYGLEGTTPEGRRNQLYINQGNNTFLEESKKYGVDDTGRGIHASFFDYDQDGDLDLFIVNHKKNTSVMEQFNDRMRMEKAYSNRLLRNDGNHFTDITSRDAGMESFGYCLGASISDINNDGWPDIYVTNDYNLPDYLFINAKDGTFRNEINDRIRHTSHYSMGIDIADINNDGYTDICVLDMSNRDYKKSKTNMGGMSIEHFWDNVARGYPYQYMYNSLQLNLGSGYYSEIANLSGIASSDWSWAPILADFDRDGLKDLFITNGCFRDVRDRDYNQLLIDYLDTKPESFDINKMLALIPQSKEINYFFQNKGDLNFENVSKDWGIDFGSVSQGAAYADLDNDGDLDLVINNLNEAATILENTSKTGNYLNLKLKGSAKNPFAIGAKVIITNNGQKYVQELYPSRGYASSSDYVLNFGLGTHESIDQIEIYWNARELTRLENVSINQLLKVDYASSKKEPSGIFAQTYAENKVFKKNNEDDFDDFERELLIPHQLSQLGPFMSKGIAENIGKYLYIGAGKGGVSQLYSSDQSKLKPIMSFTEDIAYEDGESVFFDADGDGDQDLYVVSGGNEYPANDSMYQDRLYLNNGKGHFTRDLSSLPKITSSGQCVKPNDFDNDGDIDLFIGGRQVPGAYPSAPESYWLVNDNGKFVDYINSLAPRLKYSGMITDVEFTDLNKDGFDDLIILGEWMEIQTWIYKDGQYFPRYDIIKSGENHGMKGWWNCIQPIDIDNDGTIEYLVGNLGKNNKFHPNKHHELRVYLEDFDSNGVADIVLSKHINGLELPVRGRQCLSEQMPAISEKYKNYTDFANATFNDIFEKGEDYLSVDNFTSGILWPREGKLVFEPFTNMGQIGPINEFIPLDLNGDGYMDFVAIGNRYEAEIETPRYDGNPGLVFINEGGSGVFRIYPLEINGNFANMNAKDAIVIDNMFLISNARQSVNVANITWY